MQVQSRVHSPSFHPHAHAHPLSSDQDHVRANSTHTASLPEHLSANDMNPYHHPYANSGNGPPPPPPQQRQYAQSNQLPPMYSMSMAPPGPPLGSGMAGHHPHQPIYPAAPPVQGLPQPGPGALAAQNQEGPKSLSGSNGKYRFELRVEQQPQRARMCGFGDKDRRPITPPPCVRLIIYDVNTGEEVPHDSVDGTFFVLQVDLWDDNASREVNIVKSSTASPAVSISTATTTSYPPTEARPSYDYPPGVFPVAGGMQVFGAPPPGYAHMPPAHPDMYGRMPAQHPGYPPYLNNPGYSGPANPVIINNPGNGSSNLLTRNLIGSLTVNAASLRDTNDNMGFWFVLQDLSVRTEGWFRLRMNFIDVGVPSGGGLNKTRAPVLAYVYSDKFQVYSAKKFPGVIESTPLSKCFAQQGIKIPIRKDAKANDDGDDED